MGFRVRDRGVQRFGPWERHNRMYRSRLRLEPTRWDTAIQWFPWSHTNAFHAIPSTSIWVIGLQSVKGCLVYGMYDQLVKDSLRFLNHSLHVGGVRAAQRFNDSQGRSKNTVMCSQILRFMTPCPMEEVGSDFHIVGSVWLHLTHSLITPPPYPGCLCPETHNTRSSETPFPVWSRRKRNFCVKGMNQEAHSLGVR
jgi:hypothetical protein